MTPQEGQPSPSLLQLAAHLEQYAGLFVGGWVCLERRHRPWRVHTLVEVTPETLTIGTGHIYDRKTGVPLSGNQEIVLKILTMHRLEYLLVAEALKAAEKIRLATLSESQWQALVPAAHTLLGVMDSIREPKGAKSITEGS